MTLGSPSVQWAAGALVSNAGDLARFFRALLGGRLLRPDLLELMATTVAAPQLGPGRRTGSASRGCRERCGVLWGHTGASPGYVADALNSERRQPPGRRAHQRDGIAVGRRVLRSPARAARAIKRLIRIAC